MKKMEWGYNPLDAKSIEKYADQLENKTFFEVIKEKGKLSNEAVMDIAYLLLEK